MIERREADAVRNQMIAACFTAWQMGASQAAGRTFDQYKKMYGLGDKTLKLTKEQKEKATKEALAKAAKINAAFKLNKGL